MRFSALSLLLFAAACTGPSRMTVYSRPGGAEVAVDDQVVARTVNEVTGVKIDAKPGLHIVRVERTGYEPWERQIDLREGREEAIMADLVPIPPPPQHVPIGSMEFRTDPGGARILLDGEEIGFTKSDAGAPVRVENLPPGSYRVQIVRDGFESLDAYYDVFANQTTRVAFNLRALTPYYVYPTNDDVLRQAVMRSVRGIAFLSGMRTNKTIAIVNLAGAATEEPMKNLVEDVLIAELARHGRPVVERDGHLLARLASESAWSDSLVFDVMTRYQGAGKPFLYDARLRSAAEALSVLLPGESEPRLIVSPKPYAPAQLPTADQILSYRLVEKTLRVDPSIEPGQKEKMLRRQAIIRIFVRLLDARTGLVESAERFEASLVDDVPERVYKHLENPPIQHYAYADKPAASAEWVGAEPAATVEEPEKPKEAQLLFWYYRHLGESYLRAGRFQDAVSYLREAVTLRPSDFEARLFLGEALLKNGEIDAAGKEYRAGIRALSGGGR